jgi:hypothetical protein
MTDERRIAIVTDYAGLMTALRTRANELKVTRETLDSVSGLQAGYCAKLLAPVPIRSVGPDTLGPLLGALGLAIVVIEDLTMLERVSARLVKSRRKSTDTSAAILPRKRKKRRSIWRGNTGWSEMLNARRSLILPSWKKRQIARKAIRARWRKAKQKPAAVNPVPKDHA